MFILNIEPEIEARLNSLAARIGRTKKSLVREAILNSLEDLEDGYLALERLKNPGRIFSAEEVKRELDFHS